MPERERAEKRTLGEGEAVRDFWLPTILAALIVLGALLWAGIIFQKQDRLTKDACAQGRVWACPHPSR